MHESLYCYSSKIILNYEFLFKFITSYNLKIFFKQEKNKKLCNGLEKII